MSEQRFTRLPPAGHIESRPPPADRRQRPHITVSNDELVTVRDAMRGLNRMVDQLVAGDADKFVLTRHGKMVAVVVPLSVLESRP